MSFDWLAWSNPVAIWWGFLVVVSSANIALLLLLYRWLRERALNDQAGTRIELLLLLLCAAYVFGCAFRSVLPRADVQRICLFDTWLSSVVVGRSVATVAEICFAAQWAIVLRQLAILSKADTARNISNAIVPLIVLAEVLLMVRGAHDELPRQRDREFVVGGDLPDDSRRPVAARQ